eukprot:COSAG05_NODE_24443_length_251_cov_0.967105_1_plen_40_part_10
MLTALDDGMAHHNASVYCTDITAMRSLATLRRMYPPAVNS